MATHYQEGQYQAVVRQQGFKESSNGNPMIVLVVKPSAQIVFDRDGEESEDPIHDGWDRTINLTVTEKTQEFVLDKLRAAGFEGDSFRELNLVGKEVRCRCSHEEYNGNEIEKWDLAFNRESKPVEPLDNAAARKLDAMFGKTLKKAPVGGSVDTSKMKPAHAAAVQTQAPLGSLPTDVDDVPF